MTLAEGLKSALKRAGVPVIDVSIGDANVRQTWVIAYGPEATLAHQAAGDTIRLTYTLEADTAAADEDAASAFDGDKKLKALAIVTAKRFNVPVATFRDEVIAAYKLLR